MASYVLVSDDVIGIRPPSSLSVLAAIENSATTKRGVDLLPRVHRVSVPRRILICHNGVAHTFSTFFSRRCASIDSSAPRAHFKSSGNSSVSSCHGVDFPVLRYPFHPRSYGSERHFRISSMPICGTLLCPRAFVIHVHPVNYCLTMHCWLGNLDPHPS